MPEFNIQTEEYRLHRVDYTVKAVTVEEAMQQIIRGEVEYDGAEIIEGADEVQNICTVNGEDVPQAESDHLLAEHKARRKWQRDHNSETTT